MAAILQATARATRVRTGHKRSAPGCAKAQNRGLSHARQGGRTACSGSIDNRALAGHGFTCIWSIFALKMSMPDTFRTTARKGENTTQHARLHESRRRSPPEAAPQTQAPDAGPLAQKPDPENIYLSSLKITGISTTHITGLPPTLPGAKRHRLTAVRVSCAKR